MLSWLLRHPLAAQARERLKAFEHALRPPPIPAGGTANEPIRITPHSTSWVFLTDSDEPRHLFDIVLGAHILRNKQVPDDRIHISTNHIAASQHLHPYGLRNICKIDQLDKLFGSLRGEVVVVVVGGHGTVDGVGQTKRVMSPSEVITKVRAVPRLKAGVVVLNQCFAGVFNLLDASTTPPLVLIGATNLNNSISTGITLATAIPLADGTAGVQSWSANLFSFSFFRWIEAQPDVDGDGNLTILDAYKFAGAVSNQQLLTIKSQLYMEALGLAEQLRALQQPPTTQSQDPQELMRRALTLKATIERLQETLKMLYLHQEPWILHAGLARRLAIAL